MALHEKIISAIARIRALALLLLTALLPASGTPAAAQQAPVAPGYAGPPAVGSGEEATPRIFEAGPAPSAVEVDGVLEGAEWFGAQVIPLRWEVDPGDNETAPVETTCRLTHDRDNLYLGCEAADPEPGSVRAYVTDRDGIERHDRIVLTLDPFRDARRGYVFGISALGVQYDALFDQQGQNFQGGGNPRHDPSWDAIWSSAGRLTETGWAVEAAIPFRSLRFPEDSGDRPWGILVSRFWPRSTEVELRSAPLDRDDACVLCQADRLTGLDGISPGRNVQLSPTFTASRSDEAEEGSSGLVPGSVSADPGLDLRWSPTPELALNATVNPDFSQVEADAAQLDVNRNFALFFPEKRPFFQEGADVFRTPVRAVFTRTVVDPIGGGKVTGKSGPYALGAILVRDEVNSLLLPGPQGSSSVVFEEPVTTAVGRARRDVGASSTVGGLVVAREGEGYHNRVAGADAFIQPWPSVTGRFQYLRSWTRYPAEVGDALAEESGPSAPAAGPVGSGFWGQAFQGRLRYQDREWTVSSDLRYRGERFRADAGFQPQVGVRGGNASVERVLRGGRDRWFSRLSFQVGTWGNQEIDGPLLNGGLWLGLQYRGPLQTRLTWFPNFFREGFAGEEYGMTTHYFNAGVRPWGSVGLEVQGQLGDAVDFANARKASQITLSPTLDLRLGRRTSLELSHRFQRLATADADREILEAHVSEARAVYNFSTRAFVRAILQHRLTDRNPAVHADPVSTRARSLFTQLLFSYKVNPQTLLFLGWTDDRAGESELSTRALSLEPRGRTFFLKVGYAWRP